MGEDGRRSEKMAGEEEAEGGGKRMRSDGRRGEKVRKRRRGRQIDRMMKLLGGLSVHSWQCHVREYSYLVLVFHTAALNHTPHVNPNTHTLPLVFVSHMMGLHLT